MERLTSRIVVFQTTEGYLRSQQFNGDRKELKAMGQANPDCKINWEKAVAILDAHTCHTEEQFREAICELEQRFGYNYEGVTELTEEQFQNLTPDELWLCADGCVPRLHTRWGMDVVDIIEDVIDEVFPHSELCVLVADQFDSHVYGVINKPCAVISAKDVDGRWATWFTVIPNFRDTSREPYFECAIEGDEPEECRIRLNETIPGITPEQCIELFKSIVTACGCLDKSIAKQAMQTFIDSYDWEAIAHVQDAYKDPRYAWSVEKLKEGEHK